MYSLEDLLNSRGKDSVTSAPCIWVKKPRANTQPCEVKDLVIKKIKKPSYKNRKRKYTFPQNIDRDIRSPEDTNPPGEEYLREFTQKLSRLKNDKPVILPLFRKLYCSSEENTDICDEPAESDGNFVCQLGHLLPFLASFFVGLSFRRHLSFTIESRHLSNLYSKILIQTAKLKGVTKA